MSKKKKEEDKRRRYKTQEERNSAFEYNENEINKCFIKSVGYWGIDRVDLDVIIEKVSNEILTSKKTNFCRFKRTDFYNEESDNVWLNYEEICIYDAKFGRLQLKVDGLNPHSRFIKLELFQTDINFKSGCIRDIWDRFDVACNFLHDDYGITLSPIPFINRIELCFTLASNMIIPLLVRKYIIAAFAKTNIVNAKSYRSTSTKNDKHLVTSGKYENQEYVFYDKTAKSEFLNLIPKISKAVSKREIRGYRFERNLLKDRLKNDKALRSILFPWLSADEELHTIPLSYLTDENIINYLEFCITEAIDYYCNKMLPVSISKIEEYIATTTKEVIKGYVHRVDRLIAAEQSDTDYSCVVDNESIIYANYPKKFDSSNLAKSRKNFITSDSSSFSPRSHMHGWEVERIFALMLQCLKDGLGTHFKEESDSIKYFVVAKGNYENKDHYLSELLGKRRRYVHLSYAEEAKNRIYKKWSDDNFELKPLENSDKDKH